MIERWRSERARAAAARRVLEEPGHGDSPGAERTDDPAVAREIEGMEAIVNLLQEVPAEGWAAIPAPEAATMPASRRLGRRTLRLSPILAVTAVLACLALGFGAGSLLTGGSGSRDSAHGPAVALRPLAGTPAADLATAYMPGPGRMVLRVNHLPPSPTGTYYELWLMTDAKRLAPVAAFRVGAAGRAQLTLRLPDDPRHYVYLDLSEQRVGAGTAHSNDSILRGRLT